MQRSLGSVILGIACIQAQAFQYPLLPQTRSVNGVVVDQEGRPVAGASIEHSSDHETHLTNSEGMFRLETRAPRIVFRKPGFRSGLVQTEDATNVRVTLQRVNETGLFPTCSATGQYDGIDGWSLFQFQRVPGVTASKQGHDVDYGIRFYSVDTNQGPKAIMHGAGPTWGSGTPPNLQVWESVNYEEITYDHTIIDARGQTSKGSRWRLLGRFGETASYFDVDEPTAKILDKLLDGACLKPTLR